MRLFLPIPGTRLKLLQDWRFVLTRNEWRYSGLFEFANVDPNKNAAWPVNVTLPAGTVLTVQAMRLPVQRAAERSYIRLKFRPTPKHRLARFSCLVPEVQGLNVEVV